MTKEDLIAIYNRRAQMILHIKIIVIPGCALQAWEISIKISTVNVIPGGSIQAA